MAGASTKGAVVLLFLGACLRPAASAPAAQVEPYLVEYRAYTAALESGDLKAAAAHGLAAWKAAEDALRDDRLTGILAYNYGRLIIFSATEQATAPLRRASELSQAGVADLPRDSLRLYLRYADFAASGFEERTADDLREALNTVGMEDEALVGDIAPMWLKLASEDIASGDFRRAVKSAAKAEAAIRKAHPDAWHKLAQAIVLGGAARVARTPRTIDSLGAATEEFGRARRLFPPQKDLDSFDPLLAQTMAWHHASWIALLDLYKAKGRRPPDSDDESPPTPPLFQYAADGSLKCDDFDWQERTAPEYPEGALHQGYLGAVLLGYHLGEDLQAHDARILAEVPSGERFGKTALAALSGWRVKSLPSGGTECSFVTTIRFVIE